MAPHQVLISRDLTPPLSPATQRAFDELRSQLAENARLAAAGIAAVNEQKVRVAIRDRWPRTGAWLVDHPRALKWAFRLRLRRRPTLIFHGVSPIAAEVRF